MCLSSPVLARVVHCIYSAVRKTLVVGLPARRYAGFRRVAPEDFGPFALFLVKSRREAPGNFGAHVSSLSQPFLLGPNAPEKRARTTAAAATASSSSQPAAAALKLTLSGGVPHHPSLAGLWRDERLTDFAVCAEGIEFKAHRVALAFSSKYFLNLFEA